MNTSNLFSCAAIIATAFLAEARLDSDDDYYCLGATKVFGTPNHGY